MRTASCVIRKPISLMPYLSVQRRQLRAIVTQRRGTSDTRSDSVAACLRFSEMPMNLPSNRNYC